MQPIDTRVGLIVDGDNRYLGRSAFAEWVHLLRDPGDAWLVALGLPEPTAQGREVLRLLVLGLTSPDARVWPLKLTRLLASHGDPLAGYFGAQLVSAGKLMGPGTGRLTAEGLVWIAAQVGEQASDEAVAQATARWRARVPRVGGFGVPFRDVDERRAATLRLVGDGPIARGRYWRLHEQVVAAMRPQRPNCVITFAAMLLDIGVAAEHVGVAMTMTMSHVFLAHALESAAQDGARLHALPAERVEYRGAPPRGSRGAAAEAWTPPAALRREG